MLCSACSKEGDQFIGTWSNVNAVTKLGDLLLVISREDDHILVKLTVASSGVLIATHAAHVNDGYLIVDGDALYPKLAYSKSENALLVLDMYPSGPPYRRVK